MDLESFSRTTRAAPTWLDRFDPRARVVSALAFVVLLAFLRSFPSLFAVSGLPVLLFFCVGQVRPLLGTLWKLNLANLVMGLLLALTYPGRPFLGVFTLEGVRMAFLIALRLNLIAVVLVRLVIALGIEGVDGALWRLGAPETFRVLLIFTARCVFILTDRAASMLRALRLRAPHLRGWMRWKAFAGLLGSTLIHSSDRAERTMLAMRCRGGLGGFAQVPPLFWRARDTGFCLLVLSLTALPLILFWLGPRL